MPESGDSGAVLVLRLAAVFCRPLFLATCGVLALEQLLATVVRLLHRDKVELAARDARDVRELVDCALAARGGRGLLTLSAVSEFDFLSFDWLTFLSTAGFELLLLTAGLFCLKLLGFMILLPS